MDKFQAKIDFDFKTNQAILKSISYIDSFKGKWNILEKQENIYLRELRKIATIESVGSSTRIEGAKMTDNEVKELLDNLKITKLQSRDQQEVVGYYDTIELIYENYTDIQLSKNYIFQLHQQLLKYSDKDQRHRGRYKNLPNKVVANYPNGTQKVIFNTTEPHLVESEMTELIEWTNKQLKSKELHPLITIGLFVYEILSIHPFQDGNGRLSILLTNLLLIRLDYQFIPYVSFENLIEQKKKAYYEALVTGQKNRNTKKERIDRWLLFFLNSLESLISKLEIKYDVFKQKGGYLNDRQKLIKDFIEKNQPVRLGDLVKKLTKISINTIKKDLQYLKKEHIIDSVGKNKGTIYILKK
jgi:Fic family protein